MEYKGWTVEVLAKTENGRAYLVDVRATKGARVEDLQFDGLVSYAGLRSAVKNWIDNEDLKTTLPDSGALDLTEPASTPEPEKTAAELEKEAWDADWQKLQAIQPYIDAGVFTGQETPIVNLRNRVRTNFKPSYLGL